MQYNIIIIIIIYGDIPGITKSSIPNPVFPVQNRDCENLLFSIIMLRLLFRGWSWTGQIGPLWLVLLSSAFTHFFRHSVATSIAVANPPAADSCELTCHSVGVCHKSTCRLLQGPTSFDRMHTLHSGLARSGSDLEVPVYSVYVDRIHLAV